MCIEEKYRDYLISIITNCKYENTSFYKSRSISYNEFTDWVSEIVLYSNKNLLIPFNKNPKNYKNESRVICDVIISELDLKNILKYDDFHQKEILSQRLNNLNKLIS